MHSLVDRELLSQGEVFQDERLSMDEEAAQKANEQDHPGILAGEGKSNDFRLDGVFADYEGGYRILANDNGSVFTTLGALGRGVHTTMSGSLQNELSIGTLNIGAAARERAERIFEEWIVPSGLDVYVITETTSGPGTQFLLSQFETAGWAVHRWPAEDRDRGAMIVTRVAGDDARQQLPDDPAPGRSVIVDLATVPAVRIVGMYVPNRGNDPAKTKRKEDFLAIWLRHLTTLKPLERSTILVGDLNVVPVGQNPHFLPQQPFEYAWYEELIGAQGLYDSAVAHNDGGHEPTWVAHNGECYTYDHILPATKLKSRVSEFKYDHSTRARGGGVTDHSALVIRFTVDSLDLRPTHPLGEARQRELF